MRFPLKYVGDVPAGIVEHVDAAGDAPDAARRVHDEAAIAALAIVEGERPVTAKATA